MSQYEDELAALEATKCPECHGSGTLDDADFGDISFHTWTCDKCKGTGKKIQETKHESDATAIHSGGAVTT
jgi:DnaJ-class molecular chaperone